MPGRSSSPPAASSASRPWTSVPVSWPTGMDDDAGRLVDDEQVLVLPRRAGPSPRPPAPTLGRQLDDHGFPTLEPVALRPPLAVDEHRPEAISRSASAREPTSGRTARGARSGRAG